jgi:phage replication-related protein YjqB (UPF0714/DUF867 family)
VRIKRNDHEYALYTVHETRQENPDNVVRMGFTGRDRLGADGPFTAVLDSQVPKPNLSEKEATKQSEFIEQLTDNGRRNKLIVIAPHGGAIEAHTDEQAERVIAQLAPKAVTCWRCKGWDRDHQGGAARRWHITSTDISEKSFPLLNSVIFRGFRYAVAFHGMHDERILLGGCAHEDLKKEIKDAIERATAGSGIPVVFATRNDHFNGNDPRNIVNRLTARSTTKGSIQIEQSLHARTQYGIAIADAVADVYRSKL